jgi:hypothetical protein
MRRVVLLILIGVVSLAVVGAASAVEPTRDTLVLTSRTTNPCPSGVVLIPEGERPAPRPIAKEER